MSVSGPSHAKSSPSDGGAGKTVNVRITEASDPSTRASSEGRKVGRGGSFRKLGGSKSNFQRSMPLWLLHVARMARGLNRRRWPILVFLALLVGSILAAGLEAVKELADSYEGSRRLSLDSRLNFIMAETLAVQVAGTSPLILLVASIVANPVSKVLLGPSFDILVEASANSVLQGLAGRSAGIYAGKDEVKFQEVYSRMASLLVFVNVFLAPGGQVAKVWTNRNALVGPENITIVYPGQKLYENPAFFVAMNESASRRLLSSVPPIGTTPGGPHLLSSVFPVYIPRSFPNSTFGDYPEYPDCMQHAFCFRNATSEKIWGWIGLTLSSDRMPYTSERAKDLLASGYVYSGTMEASPRMVSGGGLNSSVFEYVGDFNKTRRGDASRGLVGGGGLWTFYNFLNSPNDLRAQWRHPLYAGVAIIAVFMGGSYLRMALHRAEYQDLLENILPSSAVNRLLRGEKVIDEYHDVSIMVLEMGEFQGIEPGTPHVAIVRLLDEVFSLMDRLLERYGGSVVKISALGNSFVACSNCPVQMHPASAARILANFALDALTAANEFRSTEGMSLSVRVGLHTGPVVGAVLGYLKPNFEILSPAVNMASLIQSSAPLNAVWVSDTTAALLRQAGRSLHLNPRIIELPGCGRSLVYSLYRLRPAEAAALGPGAEYRNSEALHPSEVAPSVVAASGLGAAAEPKSLYDTVEVQLPPVRTAANGMVRTNVPHKATDVEAAGDDEQETYTQASARNPMRFDLNFPELFYAKAAHSAIMQGPIIGAQPRSLSPDRTSLLDALSRREPATPAANITESEAAAYAAGYAAALRALESMEAARQAGREIGI